MIASQLLAFFFSPFGTISVNSLFLFTAESSSEDLKQPDIRNPRVSYPIKYTCFTFMWFSGFIIFLNW